MKALTLLLIRTKSGPFSVPFRLQNSIRRRRLAYGISSDELPPSAGVDLR